MTSLTDTQVITASGGLVELGYGTRTSNLNVTATSAGSSQEVIAPVTVVCDGGPILVEFYAGKVYPASDQAAREIVLSLYEDGVEKDRQWGYQRNEATNGMPISPQYLSRRLTPSAGSHTYSVKSYVSGGTNAYIEAGTGGTGASTAFLRVSKIVQATQWPAVTTGTIICTSSTRPASPFEGQTIWEGDTDRTYVWSGAAWVSPSVSYKPPMCRAVRTSDTSYTSNTAITWQSVSSSNKGFDTDGMFSSGNATRLTVNTAGVYHVTFQPYITTSSGTYSQAYIRMNGGTVIAETDSASAIAGTVLTNVSVTYPFSVNDYIEGFVVVNGTSPTIKGVTVPSFISAAWIGNT